jgi:hypothetical protein
MMRGLQVVLLALLATALTWEVSLSQSLRGSVKTVKKRWITYDLIQTIDIREMNPQSELLKSFGKSFNLKYVLKDVSVNTCLLHTYFAGQVKKIKDKTKVR